MYLILLLISSSNFMLEAPELIPQNADGVLSAASEKHFDYFVAGLYYGFAAVAVLLNAVFCLTFKEKKIALYMALLCCILLSFAHSDGLLALWLPEQLLRVTQPVTHFMVAVFGSALALHLLKGKSIYRYLKIASITFCTAMLLLIVTGLAIYNDALLYWADVLLFSMLGAYLLAGIAIINDDLPVRLFLVSYTGVFLLALDYYLLAPSGNSVLYITNEQMKAGSMFEMVVFLMVTAYKIYRLQADKKLMQIGVFNPVEVKMEPVEVAQPDSSLDSLCALYGLTESELKVFKCIAQGMSNTEISKKLFISVNTVKYHNRNIYEKMDIKSKSQAVSKMLSVQVSSN